MNLHALCDSITAVVEREGSTLCARCLTALVADAHSADSVDVRVAVVHLALGDDFTSAETCDACGVAKQDRNPILRQRAQRADRVTGGRSAAAPG